MTYIRDGNGTGRHAGVTTGGRLLTMAVETTIEHHINHHEGRAFNLLFSQAPTAGDDCIVYLENGDTINDMIIEGISLYVSDACEVYLQTKASGTRNNATALTPANLNSGSASAALGTFEKGADLDGGAATLDGTTLEVFRYKFIAETATKHFNFDQDLVIPPNQTLTIWCSQAAVTVVGMIPFNYHNVDLM
jgi:hypothetical protein